MLENFDLFFPFEVLAEWLTYSVLQFQQGTHLAESVEYFFYDTFKIGLLLIAVNYIMAITRYYFPLEKARDILSKPRWSGVSYLLAALLGIVTPFCSCSSIPLFIGFMGAGIPIGVTFAFLISSPLINESSLYLFPALFGWKITILYNLFGLIIAVIGGMIIQKLRVEKYVHKELLQFKSRQQVEIDNGKKQLTFKQLAVYFWKDGMEITRKIFPYLLLGIGVGALIHGFVPSDLVMTYLANKSWWTVPLAVVLGAPLYANSVSVLPIMEAMVGKGAPLGTVLAFMTAIVTLSIPELLILKKVMRWQLLAIFVTVVVTGIIIMGYVFNSL